MKMEHHMAVSVVVAGAVFGVSRSWPMALASFFAGFLIAVDHSFDYLMQYGARIDVRHFFHASYQRQYDRAFLLLHSWEWALLLGALSWWSGWNPWLTGICIGMTQHIAFDQLANAPSPFGYCFFWRLRHRFHFLTCFPERER
jgi:hypothetical protein